MKKVIHTQRAPAPIGAYSQAVYVGKLLFTSGQIGIKPGVSELCSDQFHDQAVQVFENLLAIAQAADKTLNDVIKMTVYLKNLNDFSELNEVMENYFVKPYPARAAVQVARLPKDCLIEIDAVIAT